MHKLILKSPQFNQTSIHWCVIGILAQHFGCANTEVFLCMGLDCSENAFFEWLYPCTWPNDRIHGAARLRYALEVGIPSIEDSLKYRLYLRYLGDAPKPDGFDEFEAMYQSMLAAST